MRVSLTLDFNVPEDKVAEVVTKLRDYNTVAGGTPFEELDYLMELSYRNIHYTKDTNMKREETMERFPDPMYRFPTMSPLMAPHNTHLEVTVVLADVK